MRFYGGVLSHRSTGRGGERGVKQSERAATFLIPGRPGHCRGTCAQISAVAAAAALAAAACLALGCANAIISSRVCIAAPIPD